MELPESVQEIAEVIGREDALYLIGQMPPCGKRSWRVVLYVPKRLPPDHQLVRILGWRQAQRLSRHFPGEILQPSNCRCIERAHRNARIQEMARSRVSVQEIASVMQITPRQVSNVLKTERAS